MNKKKLLIISLVSVASLAFLYVQFGSPSFDEDQLITVDSGLAIGSGSINSISGNPEIIRSTAFFLQQINQLKQVQFDNVEILSQSEFTNLVDNTVPLGEYKTGRSNPFAPIDARVQLQASQRAREVATQVVNPQVFETPNVVQSPNVIEVQGGSLNPQQSQSNPNTNLPF